MDKHVKEKWVAALRSGKYEQGKTMLHDTDAATYCCLGVLAEVEVGSVNSVQRQDEEYLAAHFLTRVGLTEDEQKYLSHMNDGSFDVAARPFDEIADYIEQNL